MGYEHKGPRLFLGGGPPWHRGGGCRFRSHDFLFFSSSDVHFGLKHTLEKSPNLGCVWENHLNHPKWVEHFEPKMSKNHLNDILNLKNHLIFEIQKSIIFHPSSMTLGFAAVNFPGYTPVI